MKPLNRADGISRRAFCAVAATAGWAAAQEPATRSSTGEDEIPTGPIPLLGAGGPFAGKSWKLQYMLDEEEGGVELNDLRFASARFGIAAASAMRKGRQERFFLLTRDGGKSWSEIRAKDYILSLFVVDEKHAFAVGEDALWYSSVGGEFWERRPLPPMKRSKSLRAMRVHFSDVDHGWAYGTGKVFYRTADGGKSWTPVRESLSIELKEENTAWHCMLWITPTAGMLVGTSAAPRREALDVPDWMLPERGVRRRLLPATTVMAETRDGGSTWITSVSSTFGRAFAMRARGSRGLTLFDYGEGFEFGGEAYELNLNTAKSHSLFRRRDLVLSDAAILSGGGLILAGIVPHGRLRSSPVPGRPRFVYSPEGRSFLEMKVDYRAVGRKVLLAYVDDDNIWAATDEGFILKLG